MSYMMNELMVKLGYTKYGKKEKKEDIYMYNNIRIDKPLFYSIQFGMVVIGGQLLENIQQAIIVKTVKLFILVYLLCYHLYQHHVI